MKFLPSIVGGVVAGVILSGCGSLSQTTPSGETWSPVDRLQPKPAPLQMAPPEMVDVASLPDPTGELSLGQALEVSMARSPKLRAFRLELQRAEALELQAGLWNNPSIDAEVENVAGSGELAGVEAAETTVSLAQTFPLGRDIGRRRELAGQRTGLAEWDYEAARLEVMVEVTRRFIDALAADRRLTLARQELELAQTTEEVTTKRVEAGDASPVELARVAVPVITAKVGLKATERLRDAAYRRLSLMWDGQVGFDRVVGDLDEISPVPEPHALIRHINNNPDVARWAAAVGERIAEQRLAEAEAIPDLTARLGATTFNRTDDVALVFGVSLPLPIFDRRQGDIRAARKGEMAARERQRETELRIESMLSAAYAELLAAHDEALALREHALPAAEQAFEATRQAFAEGKLAFLDVLDAQRTHFELQRRYLDALAAYHSTTAEIESLIGQRLVDLADSPLKK